MQLDRFGLSVHGHHVHWRVLRRTPPGNPGNSIARRSRGALYPGLCRSCSISHKHSPARFCRIDRKQSGRAWEPPERMYLTGAQSGKPSAVGRMRNVHGGLITIK
jgi:hypothetical protein